MNQDRRQAKAIIQIDNDKVIVTEWVFPPYAETGWHIHEFDYVVVPQMKGQLLLESTEGSNAANLDAGKSYFRPAGVQHNVINNSDHEFIFVEIELKK